MKRLVISIAMVVLPMLIFGQECFTNGTEWKLMIRSIEYQPKTSWRNRQTLWGGCTDANPKLLLNDT